MPIVTIPNAANRNLTQLAFVTGPTVNPTIVVDLNVSEGSYYVAGEDFDPGSPTFEAAPDSVGGQYGWRDAAFTIVLHGTYRQVANTQQAIARELVKPRNWLMVIGETSAQPMFLRTYRTAQGSMEWSQGAFGEWHLPVTLRCDPALVGAREDAVTAVTVTNNPAAGSNGLYVDVPAVKGDFETPPLIWFNTTKLERTSDVWIAAEASPPGGIYFTQGAAGLPDTSVVTDAAMSGGSKVRTSFATVTTMAPRITSSIDAPIGDYRVFARVASTVSFATYQLRASVDDGLTVGETLTWTAPSTSAYVLDLGVVSAPAGHPPANFGLSGAVQPYTINIGLEAARVSATGSLDVDFLHFMPAWSRLCNVGVDTAAGLIGAYPVVDAVQDSVYATTGYPISPDSEFAVPVSMPLLDGALPVLQPGVTNRLHIRSNDSLSLTRSAFVSYWPRYLHMRPDTG